MAYDLTTTKGFLQTADSEYVRLVSLISGLWDKAKENAALAVNTELLDASWVTGRYIVEFDRNRRLGDFLKELDLTEGRSTGVPTIQEKLSANGSPRATFETTEDRLTFLIHIPVHAGCDSKPLSGTDEENSPVTTETTTESTTVTITENITASTERTASNQGSIRNFRSLRRLALKALIRNL